MDDARPRPQDTTPSPAGPAGPAPPEAAGGGRLARAAGLVSFATLLSRLLGLVRDQLFGFLFGATHVADAFNIAFRIPNLLRDLFAEGALSAAFVPTFTTALHRRSRAEAFALANRVTTTVTFYLAVLVCVGMVFTGELVHALAAGFAAEPGKTELAVALTRVMLPFLPLVSLAAVAMGMQNALGRFFVPSFAPACFNLVAIVAGAGLWLAGLPPRIAVFGWAIGTLAGGAAQFLVQWPGLHRDGFRPRPVLDLALRDPDLRRIAALMLPATVGLAATQVNIVVNSMFASGQPGAVSWLNYAFRLMQLPLGLFGVAVGTIATAALARRAAENDAAGMRRTLVQSLRLVAFLTIPAMFGLIALARPIIGLIYQHGAFTAADTAATASALTYYALGLTAYSAVKVLAPAFYAMGRPRVPLFASVSAVVANLGFNVLCFERFGYRGLAFGTALAATVNFVVLAFTFHRAHGGLSDGTLWSGVTRMVVAAVPMAAAAWGAERGLEVVFGFESALARVVDVLVPVGAGAAVYFALGRMMRLPEIDDLAGFLRRRRGGR